MLKNGVSYSNKRLRKKLCDTNKNVTKMDMIIKRGYRILALGRESFLDVPQCVPNKFPMCWHTIGIVEKSSQQGVIPRVSPLSHPLSPLSVTK